eukprot:CAMPEP_0198419202 /NCGR_PEP_ID=MMETSP1452-20131203/46_1 /TAXON_ID=1181717 /ORGANISM="Synchroma pusillum, Strain CCMP3072" /LENGTH=254 /DNA_ID=CAMNT_0044139325 /DNA_START=48 /DNA_END=812 /DNA_ORIENTATION=-
MAEEGAPEAPAPAEAKTERRGRRWFPLESNPDVMNAYAERLGLPTASYRFYDVLSVEDWALAMVPKPVIGVVFLYPITEVQENYRRTERERIEAEGQDVPDGLYYMKQTVGNACGTVGIMHALANARGLGLDLAEGSYMARFLERTKDMTPDERAADVEADDELEESHMSAAQEGQTENKDIDEPINTHFVAFSCMNGTLVELDGRKASPICHGPSSPETLLEDACRVVQTFMARDPSEMRFTIVALAAASDDA